VSDHEIWPDLRSRPRPQKRSLTPRCFCLSRSRRSPQCDRSSPQRRAQSALPLHRPSHSIVRFAIACTRRSALLRPRMRAAGGLDRAIREPVEGNYRRPHVNFLTTRADSAIVEFSSTVATRNPLHIARGGALESAASDHDSFLSIHSLVADSCDDTSAEQAIGTDCASASDQRARSRQTSQSTSSRCHGISPVSRRCLGAALSAAHPK
jgi:hypothetical protein